MNPIYIVLISIASFLLLLFFAFVFLVSPRRYRKEMDCFKDVRYAHRGLHSDTVAENSMTAFRLALEGGYGIEFDVRLSSDGEVVVFHDDTLDRVTDEKGKVSERSAEELSKINLMGTSDTIPTLKALLKLVDGRVPLLVEIKELAGQKGLSEKVVEILKEYKGPFIVESFNPMALAKVKKLAPDILRGQLSSHFFKNEKYRNITHFLLQHMLFNFMSRPDFISYDHTDYKMPALRFIKRFYKAPLIAWTLESAEEDALAKKNGFSGMIFQFYSPKTRVSEDE